LRNLQRLVDIGNDIVHVLDADGKANEVGRHSTGDLLLLAQLLVGRGSRMNDQRLGVTDIGQVGQQLDVVDKLLPRFDPSLDAESDDCSGTLGEVPGSGSGWLRVMGVDRSSR
jgi:hypothetical protein